MASKFSKIPGLDKLSEKFDLNDIVDNVKSIINTQVENESSSASNNGSTKALSLLQDLAACNLQQAKLIAELKKQIASSAAPVKSKPAIKKTNKAPVTKKTTEKK